MASPGDSGKDAGHVALNDKIHRSHIQALLGHAIAGSDRGSEGPHHRKKKKHTLIDIPLPPRRSAQKAPKPHDRGMEFLHEKKDYNVAEFYEHFNNDLPKTAMVNQGFCGAIVEDTFDREQVLRVHAVSKQPRVIAKFQYGNNSRLLSIPLSYEEKLCIVKRGGKHGKPKQIGTILRENTLPITVQFPKDHEITVGNQTISSNNIPSMELVQSFEEVYLLANFITDGVMSQGVVHVPLYLSQLRLAVVTGIKGQPKEKWTGYQQELDRAASYIEFDEEFGNLNIAEYDPSAIHSDTTYTYVEPKVYSNIISLVHKNPSRAIDNMTYNKPAHHHEEGPNVYEEIDNTAREHTTHNKQGKHKKPVDQTFKKELETALKTELQEETTPKLTSFKTQQSPKYNVPPPLAPKPHVTHTDADTGHMNDGHAPTLPKRRAIPPVPKPPESLHAAHALYTNDVPRSSIPPTFHVAQKSDLKPKPGQGQRTVRDVNSADDVAKLTIDEVTQYLTKLKLEKYAENFKNQLIDGAMLGELDKDTLKEDFGMKGIEAIRLMKFTREGHVPN